MDKHKVLVVVFPSDNEQSDKRQDEGKFLTEQKWEHLVPLQIVKNDNQFTNALAQDKPNIVHIIGHGDQGRLLAGVDGDAQDKKEWWSPQMLAERLKGYREHCWLVVLTVCESESSAKEIAQHIRFAIGMKAKIDDKHALEFTKVFYSTLDGVGDPRKALEVGKNVVACKEEADKNQDARADPTLFPEEILEKPPLACCITFFSLVTAILAGLVWLFAIPGEPVAEVEGDTVSIGWVDALRACPLGARRSFCAPDELGCRSESKLTLNLDHKKTRERPVYLKCEANLFCGNVTVATGKRDRVPLKRAPHCPPSP